MPTRRSFVVDASVAAAAAVGLPREVWARAAQWGGAAVRGRPVRVRGRVHTGGRGLARVAVSDGLQVVTTGADGRFELVTTSARRFVSCSIPRDYALPRLPTGALGGWHRLDPERADHAVEFSLTPLGRDEGAHAVLAFGDPQTQDAFEMGRFAGETIPDARGTVAALDGRAAFAVGVGDLMFDDLSLYPDYERAMAATGLAFASVVGNHDLEPGAAATDEASTATFERHFGPPYRSFDRGEVHYVILDDVFWHGAGYLGYLTAEQLLWLEADLALVEPGRTVVVFTHIPLASTRPARSGEGEDAARETVTNRAALYRLLAPYRTHVVSGHTHEHEHVIADGVHEHVIGTACGAWWSGDICWDGTPNGYLVLDVTGSDVRWRYQGTGLAPERRASLHAPGSDGTAPEELVANVWDWDPTWTVAWYEGADRRGLMARRRGTDPRAEREQRGRDKPARRTWVEPVATDHLFYCRPSGAGPVSVEITDRWGRTWREALTP